MVSGSRLAVGHRRQAARSGLEALATQRALVRSLVNQCESLLTDHRSILATAIAVGAIRAGHRALVRSVFDLVQDFAEAEATGERRAFVQQLTRVDLLVLEDFGMKKLGPAAAEDLLEVFVRRHEAGSTLITTNRPTQDWGVFLGDVPAATAILDRFLAHAEIVQLQGKSYRLHQRRTRDDPPAEA